MFLWLAAGLGHPLRRAGERTPAALIVLGSNQARAGPAARRRVSHRHPACPRRPAWRCSGDPMLQKSSQRAAALMRARALDAKLKKYIEIRRRAAKDGRCWLVEEPPFESNWNDPETRSVGADAALTLIDTEHDDPIRLAFKEYDLDPLNPFEWRLLLWFLADNAYGGHRAPDTREKWDEIRLGELLVDYRDVKVHCEQKKKIHYLLLARYRNLDGETIRRRISDAMRMHIVPIVARLRENYAKEGIPRSKQQLQDEALDCYARGFQGADRNETRKMSGK